MDGAMNSHIVPAIMSVVVFPVLTQRSLLDRHIACDIYRPIDLHQTHDLNHAIEI